MAVVSKDHLARQLGSIASTARAMLSTTSSLGADWHQEVTLQQMQQLLQTSKSMEIAINRLGKDVHQTSTGKRRDVSTLDGWDRMASAAEEARQAAHGAVLAKVKFDKFMNDGEHVYGLARTTSTAGLAEVSQEMLELLTQTDLEIWDVFRDAAEEVEQYARAIPAEFGRHYQI